MSDIYEGGNKFDDKNNKDESSPELKKETTDKQFDGTLKTESHFCAGEVISPEEYRTLATLVSSNDPVPNAMKAISLEVATLSLQTMASFMKIFFDYNNNLLFKTIELSGDNVYKEMDAISGFGADASALVTDLRDSCRQEYSESDGDSKKEGNAATRWFAMELLAYKLGFFVSDERSIHSTDIRAVVDAISPQSEGKDTLIEYINEIMKESSDEDSYEAEDRTDELTNKLYGQAYTTLPPNIIRATAVALDDIITKFLTQNQNKVCDINVFKKSLENFEDSFLAFPSEESTLRIEYDDTEPYKIVLANDVPAMFSRSTEDSQKELEKKIEPYKHLYQKIGGDIGLEIDQFEIKMTISLPPQKDPEVEADFDRPFSQEQVFQASKSSAPLESTPVPFAFCIGFGDGKISVPFSFNGITLESSQLKKELSNFIQFIEPFANDGHIDRVTIASFNDEGVAFVGFKTKFINGISEGENDFSILSSPMKLLGNQELSKEIYNLLTSVNCSKFYLLGEEEDVCLKRVSSIKDIMDKAKELSDDPLELIVDRDTDEPELKIMDSAGNMLVCAAFDEERQVYGGRFVSVENLNKFLSIYDEISSEFLRKDPNAARKNDIVVRLSIALFGKGVVVKDGFVGALNKFAAIHQRAPKRNVDDLFYECVKDFVKRGMTSIKMVDGKLELDCPLESNYKEFFEDNIL